MSRLAKARILKIVNFRQEDIPILEALEAILKRDGKEFSEWAREQADNHVKAHREGNDIVPLSKFVEHPDMIALPTMGERVRPDISNENLEEVLKAINARSQEAKHIAKQRGWWIDDRTGEFERRNGGWD